LEIAKIVFHLGIEFVKNAVSSMKDDLSDTDTAEMPLVTSDYEVKCWSW